MVTTTLDKMAAGGIYDQVGGGFHRYSTDAQWLVPHFEKMLYDNAQLAVVYLEAWQHTGDPAYQRVCARNPGLCRARDDGCRRAASIPRPMRIAPLRAGTTRKVGSSPGRQTELERLLGARRRSGRVRGVWCDRQRGNFEGRNILHRVQTDREVGAQLRIPVKRVAEVLDQCSEALSTQPGSCARHRFATKRSSPRGTA